MFWVLLIVVVLGIVFAVVITKDLREFVSSGNPTEDDAVADSTEDSPSAVTPAPSPLGDEETNSCLVVLVVFIILIVLAFSWFNSWLKEEKRKSNARKREFQNGVKKWMRLFKGGG